MVRKAILSLSEYLLEKSAPAAELKRELKSEREREGFQ